MINDNKIMNWEEIVKVACTEDEIDYYDDLLSKENKKILWIRTTEIGGL